MHDYQAFCEHYALNPETDEARRDYQEYRDALAALKALGGVTAGSSQRQSQRLTQAPCGTSVRGFLMP